MSAVLFPLFVMLPGETLKSLVLQHLSILVSLVLTLVCVLKNQGFHPTLSAHMTKILVPGEPPAALLRGLFVFPRTRARGLGAKTGRTHCEVKESTKKRVPYTSTTPPEMQIMPYVVTNYACFSEKLVM